MEQPDQTPHQSHASSESNGSSGQVLALVSLLVAGLSFPGCLFGGLTLLTSSRDIWPFVTVAVLGVATLLPVVALAKLHSVQPANGAEVPAITALGLVGFWWVMAIVMLGLF